MPVVDIHTHFFPENWTDLAARFGTPDWPWMKHTEPGKAVVMLGNREFRQIYSACWDPDVRLAEMDRDGIDLQIVSATPVLFAYRRPAQHALECAQIFNDAALELCSRGRGRLHAICQVPLQDTDAACRELSRAMRAGHIGVQIGNHVGDRNLDDEGILTFLQHCAAEGAAVLVHPWDMLGAERMPRHMMPWTVAMPAETQLSIATLILSGAFDRLPPTLRICFVHGGGSFPYLLGRMENAWHHHPVARGVSKYPPSSYLGRFSVDSAVFDQRTLQYLVNSIGDERVMLGSDYPFPLGEERVGALIRDSKLAGATKAKLLGDNALRFFALPLTEESPHSAAAVQVTYSTYLHVPELLELQQPLSSPPHHDELLFIIIHQTYELWFKQILHELDLVVARLKTAAAEPASHEAVYEAARLLRRCTEIMRVLVEQFTVLETMLPTHFLAFRGKLRPASGFQSEQFREIEFLCGLKDEKMLRFHEPTPEAYSTLHRRLREPSLRDVLFEALEALGNTPTIPADATDGERFEAHAQAIRALYDDERNHRHWIDLCERLTEFDELAVSWRLRHIQMVERTIGVRIGTGGSTGASYLRLTLDKKFFPELWEARMLLAE